VRALKVTILEPDPTDRGRLVEVDTELLTIDSYLSLPLGDRELLIEEIDNMRVKRAKGPQ
jgi:hypothetical protein